MRKLSKNALAIDNLVDEAIHSLFDSVEALSVQGYNEDREVIYWNKGSEVLYGFSRLEAMGRKLEDLIIPAYMRQSVINAHSNWLRHNIEIPAAEITLHDKRQKDVNVFSNHVMFANQYRTKQMYCIDINLAEIKQAQAQVILKDNIIETVFEAIPDLFFLLKEDATIIDYRASNDKKLNFAPQQFVGRLMTSVLPSEAVAPFNECIEQVITRSGVSQFNYAVNLLDGVSHFEARLSYLKDNQQVVVIIRDITEQHESAQIIRKHAYYDALTSLPNRFLSLDRLEHMIEESKRTRSKTAVLFLDLDDFKKVNDSLGHEVGDKLLIEASKRLSYAIRKEDTVGRLGGDEFIVLLHHIIDEANAMDIVTHLLHIFTEPFHIDNRELILTLSIGIAICPENGKNASDLLRNADTAMYQAKANGRNTYSFFTDEMNVIMLRRFEIEEQMHLALERNEFTLYFQPKIDLKNRKVMGAEALLRWVNPKLGVLEPDEFIPIAEQTGLIVPIGEFAINKALEVLNKWQLRYATTFTMAINLSPRQFRHKSFLDTLKHNISTLELDPKLIEFEITEGVLMMGKSYIDEALNELREIGVKLSMDDFGTGYSSLSYLRHYAFDVIKIDQTFVKGLPHNKADCDLVKATIAMANSLGLSVVAEGIETLQQLTALEKFSCDFAQGFYFSEPLSEYDLLAFDKF